MDDELTGNPKHWRVRNVSLRKGNRWFRFCQYQDLNTGHWGAYGGDVGDRIERPTIEDLTASVIDRLASL